MYFSLVSFQFATYVFFPSSKFSSTSSSLSLACDKNVSIFSLNGSTVSSEEESITSWACFSQSNKNLMNFISVLLILIRHVRKDVLTFQFLLQLVNVALNVFEIKRCSPFNVTRFRGWQFGVGRPTEFIIILNKLNHY